MWDGTTMRINYTVFFTLLSAAAFFWFSGTIYGATVLFVSPTPNNTANSTAFIFYINITSNENLNQSKLSWTNSTGTINLTMSNTSLTNWNITLTNSTTPLNDGSYSYEVWAQNTTGLWNTSETRTLTIDRTRPSIINFTINDTSPSQNTFYLLEVNYNESHLRYANLTVLYSNGTIYTTTLLDNFPSQNKSNKTIAINNVEGNFTFRINLTDWAGNYILNSTILQSDGNYTQNFTIDTKEPVLRAVSPIDYTNKINTTIKANITDINLNSSTISFYFNNSKISSSNFTLTAITNGYQLQYTAHNLENNKTYYVNVSANDTYSHKLNLSSGSWSFKTDFTTPTKISNFIINNTAVQTPTSNYTYNRNNLTLNWTLATDSISYVFHYDLWARNRSFNSASNSFDSWTSWYILNSSIGNTTTSYLVGNLADDYQYEFNLTAYDAANNSNTSSTLNATIDLNAPEISVYSNGTYIKYPNIWTNFTNLTIWLNISDISGINNNSINVTFNSTYPSFTITPNSQNQTTYKISFNVSNLENNHNYTIIVYANDTLNQKAAITYNISTDFTAPTINSVLNLSAPYSGSGGWYKDSVVMRINCSDALSGVYRYATNESTYSNNWGSSTDFTIDTTGDLTYIFKCMDRAGNIATTTKKIAVDASSPVINYISRTPQGSAVPLQSPLKINYSDSGSGINTNSCVVKYKMASQNSYTSLSGVSCGLTGLYKAMTWQANTQYFINISVYDKVGHHDQESWSFITQGGTTTQGSSGSTTTENTNSSNKTYYLIWQNIPSAVNVFQGNTSDFEVKLKNAGTETIFNITITLSGTLNKTIIPSKISSIISGATKPIKINLSASENYSIGIYELTIKAQGDKATATTSLKVKVQPKANETYKINKSFEKCLKDFKEVQKLFEEANKTVENKTSLNGISILLNEIQKLISQANQSLASGDYAQAAQLEKEIKQKITTAKSTLESIVNVKKTPIWLYIVIPLVLVSIIGIILYVSLVPEEKRTGKKLKVPAIKLKLPKRKGKTIQKPNYEPKVLENEKIKKIKKGIKEEKKKEYSHEKELRKIRKQQIKQNLGKYASKFGKKLKKIVKKD